MDSRCYFCDYYDEMFDGEEEHPLCMCDDDNEPEWCPERSDSYEELTRGGFTWWGRHKEVDNG